LIFGIETEILTKYVSCFSKFWISCFGFLDFSLLLFVVDDDDDEIYKHHDDDDTEAAYLYVYMKPFCTIYLPISFIKSKKKKESKMKGGRTGYKNRERDREKRIERDR